MGLTRVGLTRGRPGRSAGALLAALLVTLSVLVAVPSAGAALADEPAPASTRPPVVKGSPEFGSVLRAGPGGWEPADVALSFRWLRDGTPIPGATARRLRLGLDDLGTRVSVEVTATGAGGRSTVTSDPTRKVDRAVMRNRRPPTVAGVLRFGRTLEARPGRWSGSRVRLRHQWLRSGRPIRGATDRRYRLAPEDVGARIRVRVTATAPGWTTARRQSPRQDPVGHRVDVRRTVTYHVETRGRITTSLRAFRQQAQQTFEDPRGWRGAGVRFRPVARGGAFTLVLAEAGRVPGFSSGCSSQWSCRVGRYVIINQERWKHASPGWNAAGGSLGGYRHMVVNHETGHWLGRGHSSCPGAGQPAPVMMQQSKGLAGCSFNPWPTLRELGRR